MLTPEEQKEIQEHSRAIAKILYKHTEPESPLCKVAAHSAY
jgi:hypothetical protein